MYELLKESIKPELCILIPVLYLVGIAIKKSKISDSLIPFILGGVSIVLSLLYLLSQNGDFSMRGIFLLLFTGITQGILIAGASVYANQLIKQANNVKEISKK